MAIKTIQIHPYTHTPIHIAHCLSAYLAIWLLAIFTISKALAENPIDQDPFVQINQYKQQLQLNPNSVELRLQLGRIYLSVEAFDEAINEFQKAMALSPNRSEIHYGLGLAYF